MYHIDTWTLWFRMDIVMDAVQHGNSQHLEIMAIYKGQRTLNHIIGTRMIAI